ncbi:cysteine rich repeat-containing protein [Rhodovastum atsumiense]|nr:cysteine rich repeat-containing protein [Rhodovastum atsumiense]
MMMRYRRANGIARPGLRVAALVLLGLCGGLGTARAQQPSPQPGQAVRQACTADYQIFCAGVQPGRGRALACLQQHATTLSEGCQQALQAAKAARQAQGSRS